MDGSPALRFGPFELQARHRRLLRDGEPVTVGARAFDVLLALAERRDRIVTKAELMELVWPGLVVEENNLQVQISSLRKLLGADAIATIPGRGYRFTAALAGHEEVPSIKHRLVAILAADAVGYTRLMAADDHATVAALDAARDVFRSHIEAHQGRVIDMAGDSVLAVFGTATGAVSAALAVQDELGRLTSAVPDDRRMRFRIGVHLGDVIEKPGGSVYGDGINIAARLQSLADPGTITVSESIRSAVKGKVEATFEDRGVQTVKNIGEPLRVHQLCSGTALIAAPQEPAIRPALSVVVLPFDNLGGDVEQAYLADAITEDLTTDLSRIVDSFVISCSTAFTYKGKSIDVKQTGVELGVRYVLEGSIRKIGNRVRVNAQLIETEHGAHVWADRFDREFGDILTLQDEITDSIAQRLRHELVEAESRRSLRDYSKSPQAVDYILRARAAMTRGLGYTHETMLESRTLYSSALQLEPVNVSALVGLADTWLYEVVYGWSNDVDAALAQAESLIGRAEAITSNDVRVLRARGLFLRQRRRPELALPYFKTALARDPNDVGSMAALGTCCMFLAEPEAAIAYVEGALKRDPRGFNRGNLRGLLGTAKLYLGQYEEAIHELELCSSEVSYAFPWFMLAAAFALAGRVEQAHIALQEFRRLRPGVGISRLREEALSSDPRYLKLREPVYEGLRRAGLED